MPSTRNFVEFICDQLHGVGVLRIKKMFGEFFIYINDRPIILICDDTAFIKPHQALEAYLSDCLKAPPFRGAKQWYVLDADNQEQIQQAARIALPLTPIPIKKSPKKTRSKDTTHHFFP